MNNPNAPNTLTNTELGIAMDAVRQQLIDSPRGVGCNYVDSRAILLRKLLIMFLIQTGGKSNVETETTEEETTCT